MFDDYVKNILMNKYNFISTYEIKINSHCLQKTLIL
jgi:hypothetical protein